MLRRLLLPTLLLGASTMLAAQVPVASGVMLIPGYFAPGDQSEGNSVVFEAPDGLVVMDTGRHPEHAAAILRMAGGRTPIAAIVNSHWHLDHIGGNDRLRTAFPGAKVYASGALAEARAGFLANYRKRLSDMIAAPNTSDADRATFRAETAIIDNAGRLGPTVVIDKPGPMVIAGREFDIGLERFAVTAGDIWMLDRDSGTLAAGDLVTLPAPFLDTACPTGWKAALDKLQSTTFRRVIPGHGRVLTRNEFGVYNREFAALLQCASGNAPTSACVDGWINGTASLVSATDADFTRGLMNDYVDLLRQPATEVAKLCGK